MLAPAIALAALTVIAAPSKPPSSASTRASSPSGRGTWTRFEVQSSTITDDAPPVEVLLYAPRCAKTATISALVVALAGWDHRAEQWRAHSRIGELADDACVVVAAPSLGKSVFETAWFADTKRRALPTPGTRWVGELFLPWLRARPEVPSSHAPLAIVGYSTGGRGALMVAGAYPGVAFAASLSGTYDLDHLAPGTGEYAIHEVVYGPRHEHEARWTSENVLAPRFAANLAHVTLYLAHGANDRVVPPDQLARAEAHLRAVHHPAFTTTLDPRGAHDWRFWNRALEAAFRTMKIALTSRGAR